MLPFSQKDQLNMATGKWMHTKKKIRFFVDLKKARTQTAEKLGAEIGTGGNTKRGGRDDVLSRPFL